MINLSFVQPKNKLKILKYNTELVKLISDRIIEIDNYNSLKFDNELLKFVCTCIENGLKDKNEKKNKTDKKLLALEIYHKVFSINDAERLILSNSIQFLHDNNLILKFNDLVKCGHIFLNYIKSKI